MCERRQAAWRAAMPRASTVGVGLFSFLVANNGLAFTQRNEAASATGHEFLVVSGAHRVLPEPHTAEVNGVNASCRTCDRYDTYSWNIWSLVMGNRWADIGGYSMNPLAENALSVPPKKCFDQWIQDSDGVQYQHALRKKCDFGAQGLKRAHSGTVALIRDRFMRAVKAKDEVVWFSDGGMMSLRFKARRPSFILGMAIHALQDSFSEEHAVRSNDWHVIVDLKTYVKTAGAPHHANPEENADRFKMWGVMPTANESHGDYAFKHFGETASIGDMKDSAKAAVMATSDLVSAYEGALKVPPDQRDSVAQKLFDSLVVDKWLRLDNTALDAPKSPGDKGELGDAGCSAPALGSRYGAGVSADAEWQEHEKWATLCAAQSGVEGSLSPKDQTVGVFGEMPQFCWPKSSCHDNTAEHIANGIVTAGKWFTSTLGSFGKAISDFIKTGYTKLRHQFHSRSECIGESSSHGVNTANTTMSHANYAASQYWGGLSGVLGVLVEKAERQQAVDANWKKLRAALIEKNANTRKQSCEHVRLFFNVADGKTAGVTACQAHFDAHTSGYAAMLDASYELNIVKGLPEQTSFKPQPPPADLMLTIAPPKREQHAAVAFAFLPVHPSVINLFALSTKRAPNLKPMIASSAAAKAKCLQGGRAAECELAHNARLRLLGQQTPSTASETHEQKADRIDAELQACLQSPIMAAQYGTAAPERCLAMYHGNLEADGVAPTRRVSPSIYGLQTQDRPRDMDPTWRRMAEGGQDLGIAHDGTIWLVGEKASHGGFELKRSNASHSAFRTVPGGATRISAGGASEVWVVNDVGDLYRRGRTDWEAVSGVKARDIAVGADGSVWAIGTEKSPGGFAIYEFEVSRKKWDKVDGGGMRIAVDAAGDPWVVNDVGAIYQRVDNRWIKRPGSAKDIAVGANGSVWVIGTDAATGGNGIWHWNPSSDSWDNKKGGGGTNIAVGPRGLPCVVNDARQLWCMM